MTVPYNGVGDWSIENAQRDAIAYGLEDAAPDDLIFISDLDEFPAPDIVQRLNANEVELLFEITIPAPLVNEDTRYTAKMLVPAIEYLDNGAVTLQQNFHYYYFDWISNGFWLGTLLVKRKNLTTPQSLRNNRFFFPRIENGGWHFSYMGGVDRVINKMNSIVDGNEMVVKSGGRLADKKHVEESMANGTDVYGRQNQAESQFLPFDARNIKLPHLNTFLKKYPHFLREPEKYFTN